MFARQVLFAGDRGRGTGEFDSRDIFRAICKLHEEGRYEGFAALEDRPSGPGPERWPKHANWQLHGRFSGQGDSVRAHGRPAATGRPNTRADGRSSDGCLGAPLGQPPRESSRHAGQPHGSAAKAGRAAPQEQDSDGDSQGSIRCAGFRARPSRREGQDCRRDHPRAAEAQDATIENSDPLVASTFGSATRRLRNFASSSRSSKFQLRAAESEAG